MEARFFRCEHCGNVIIKAHDSKVPVMCCGEKMVELVPNTVEASTEKHMPEVEVITEGAEIMVKVGSVEHPMTEEHYIEFVATESCNGVKVRALEPGDFPGSAFAILPYEKMTAIYSYCNLHGLWKLEL